MFLIHKSICDPNVILYLRSVFVDGKINDRSVVPRSDRETGQEVKRGNKNNIIECNLREMFVSVEFIARVDDFGACDKQQPLMMYKYVYVENGWRQWYNGIWLTLAPQC